MCSKLTWTWESREQANTLSNIALKTGTLVENLDKIFLHLLEKIDDILRHKYTLAPILFNIAPEKIIQTIPVDLNDTMRHQSSQRVAYAGNINILAREEKDAKKALMKFDEEMKEVGSKMNEEKTSIMQEARRKHQSDKM